jgi:hypothetical protein
LELAPLLLLLHMLLLLHVLLLLHILLLLLQHSDLLLVQLLLLLAQDRCRRPPRPSPWAGLTLPP